MPTENKAFKRFAPAVVDAIPSSLVLVLLPAFTHLKNSGAPWLKLIPGLVLTAIIAVGAMRLAEASWLQSTGLSALTLAIVLGMLVGNTLFAKFETVAGVGVTFSKAMLLRLGVILYGLRLTFRDIGDVGWAGIMIDATVMCSTFGLACYLGTRLFGMERKTAMLIGAGSSICGAAAVMATAPVVRGRADQVTVAVATVVVFGTVAIFLYPVIYHLNSQYRIVDLSPTAYGVFAGSTIHEVAQVVAAGRAISEQAANTAVIAKMVRVMLLAPFLMMLSAWISTSSEHHHDAPDHGHDSKPARIVIPWFALGFVAVTGLNSTALLPAGAVHLGMSIDTFLLTMAMAGLGLTTHLSAMRTAGIKPLALGAVLFVWLICGGFAINAGINLLSG